MTNELFTANFESLISADMYIIIAAVYGICAALKRARFFDDRFIPLAAIILGAALALLSNTTGEMSISDALLRGIVCGMSAVFAKNVRKQIKSEKNEVSAIDEQNT